MASRLRYAWWTAGFAALYLLATVAGRATGDGVPPFWPAAAVGAVWLVAQARFGLRRLDVIALATAAAVVPATGHGILAALALAVPEVVPAVLFAWLLERWLPGYWRGHGDRFRRPGPTLARLAAAAATAAAAGALLRSVVAGEFAALDAGYLLVRDASAVLLTILVVRAVRTTHGRAPASTSR